MMKFERALEKLREGSKITKKSWGGDRYIVMYSAVGSGDLIIHMVRASRDHTFWRPDQKDVLDEDYQILDDEEKIEEIQEEE